MKLCQREDGRVVFDRLRTKVWKKKPLDEKFSELFEILLASRGSRWSFHQSALRDLFLDMLKSTGTGEWINARCFLDAVIARYLATLEERGVRQAYRDLRENNFQHHRVVVTLDGLHRDLSYWVLHGAALTGLVDVGFRQGRFHALRLSSMGMRFFKIDTGPDTGDGPRLLVDPDFEILIYPEAPEEWNWEVSQFADRLESDYIKRYRISRESIKRAVVAGMSCEDITEFLRRSGHGSVPPNVMFSLREWTEGVEIIRKSRVTLLRGGKKEATDRLADALERREIPFERIGDVFLAVRGTKNERALKDLQGELRDWGLIIE